ncbi:MAG: Ig-like domain-containing protein [Bacteroidetes bacterium]|nr:Ig-like domain-containing protein [Bacteroidota bacterium]
MCIVVCLHSCEQNKIKNIYFKKDKVQLSVHEQYTAELFMEPFSETDYDKITWKSSDNSVAVVDKMGHITAVYTGSCIVTARCGKLRASIEVAVLPINIAFDSSKALAYFYGDSYDNSYNTVVVRFLSDGCQIEPNGDITGAGTYINMQLFAPKSTDSIALGTFRQSNTPMQYAFLSGYLREHNDRRYVLGSYFGNLSGGGNSVVLIKEGVFNISKRMSQYVVEGVFRGDKDEVIELSYSGKIPLFDRSNTTADTVVFDRRTSAIDDLGDLYNVGCHIFRVKYSNNVGDLLQIEMATPLIAKSIVAGEYSVGSSIREFSLVPSDMVTGGGTIIKRNGILDKVLYGRVRVFRKSANSIIIRVFLVTESRKIIVNTE